MTTSLKKISGLLVLLLILFITGQAQLIVTPTVTPPCSPGTGSVTFSVSGGTGPFTYDLYNQSTGQNHPNQSSATFGGLSIGTYYVYVSNGLDSGTLQFNISSSIHLQERSLAALCSQHSGSASVTPTGGTGPYHYHWDNGDTTQSLSNLAAGNYYVYVTDASGCQSDTAAINVLDSSSISVSIASNGYACSPTLSATVTGSVSTINYHWSNTGSNSSTSVATFTGTYAVTARDLNGCSATASVYINATSLSLDSTSYINPDCLGHLGSITAHALNGIAPYTYLWSNGDTSSSLSGLASGQYQVTVTDSTGCSGVKRYYLSPTQLSAFFTVDSNPGCTQSNGAVNVTAYTNSGSSAFSYLWSTGGTTSTINHIPAGTYTVTISDAVSGCRDTASVSVASGNAPYVYVDSLTNPTCGSSNGELSVYAYNGAGSYTYLWSNGATGPNAYGLSTGRYSVTVSDASGCTDSTSYSLVAHANFLVNITTTTSACDTSLHTGSATAIVTGAGIPPYHFTWYQGYSQTVIGNTQTISGLPANDYITVNVTDSTGCSSLNPYSDSAFIQFDPACYDHITGYVFVDSNGNCALDSGEQGYSNGYIIAHTSGGQYYYGSLDSTGFYDIAVLQGTYIVYPQTFYWGGGCNATSCINSDTVTFTTTGQVSSGNNFPLFSNSSFDLGVHMGYQGSSPGQQREYWIYYYNWGQASVPNGVLRFIHDPSITLVSTTPAYTSYNAATQTITWDIVNNLAPMHGLDYQHKVIMYFDIPSSLTLGSILTAHADISPVSGDCDPSDNSQDLTDPITASHDPNEKQVSPVGNLSEADSVLTYTIRFENNGNGPASRVVVTDQLSSNVNPASVLPGASSAPYKYTISGNGLLTFTFDAINLPDSASNPNGSRGFVMYTVHTKPNLVIGSQIDNTASIFFDLNPAIVTNTTINVRSDHPNGISSINGGAMTAQVIPNPAHDRANIEFSGATGVIELRITDALGNTIAVSNVDSKSYTLHAESLSSGVYFYTAKDVNGNTAAGKISVVH